MANKGGTAETKAFSSFFIRTRALFYLYSVDLFCAKVKRQRQMFSVAKAERQLQMFSVAKAERQLQLRQGEIDFELEVLS
ncbi:hypothetical protein ACIQ1D_01160 [Lysinibacillus xylanilyticus]|uniref:hypothetical protein n=1 Tax=Lysinibacillus xylanilyticus TaxID=582475 RepID=UPI00382E0306